jgi:hypothetical protein
MFPGLELMYSFYNYTMIIYNVTTKVHETIHDAWLHWLKSEHIPAILDTGCFTTVTIARLLEVDDVEGPTYTVQYRAESKAQYNKFIEQYSAGLSKVSFNKWGDRFISFAPLCRLCTKCAKEVNSIPENGKPC